MPTSGHAGLKDCENACGCRKAGQKCSVLCSECAGINCTNTADDKCGIYPISGTIHVGLDQNMGDDEVAIACEEVAQHSDGDECDTGGDSVVDDVQRKRRCMMDMS